MNSIPSEHPQFVAPINPHCPPWCDRQHGPGADHRVDIAQLPMKYTVLKVSLRRWSVDHVVVHTLVRAVDNDFEPIPGPVEEVEELTLSADAARRLAGELVRAADALDGRWIPRGLTAHTAVSVLRTLGDLDRQQAEWALPLWRYHAELTDEEYNQVLDAFGPPKPAGPEPSHGGGWISGSMGGNAVELSPESHRQPTDLVETYDAIRARWIAEGRQFTSADVADELAGQIQASNRVDLSPEDHRLIENLTAPRDDEDEEGDR